MRGRQAVWLVVVIGMAAPAAALGADAPEQGAAVWARADAAVFTDTGGAVTTGEVLRGRMLPGDPVAAARFFAVMAAKDIRSRVSAELASSASAKAITRGEVDQVVRFLAEHSGTRQESLRAALDYDAALLQALIAEAEGGPAADAAGDEAAAARLPHLRLLHPTAEARKERLRVIQTESPEFAAYGEMARQLMERIRAAEVVARAPVAVSDAEIRKAQAEERAQIAADPSVTRHPLSGYAQSMKLRIERAERILLGEVRERIENGEIIIHDAALVEPIKTALTSGSGIGWL